MAAICEHLRAYQASMHCNGQSSMRIDGLRASGVTWCLVHHLKVEGTVHTVMIAAIRYLDSYVKRNSAWLIRQRQVMVDWTATQTLTSG